jgi:hypothetical protein
VNSLKLSRRWRCCTTVCRTSALAVVFENLGPLLLNFMYIIHIPCIVKEI